MNNFQWTDELVLQFVGDGTRQVRDQYARMMPEFKASKEPVKEWEIVEDSGTIDSNGRPERTSIHSVRRLSDGEVFSVGDRVRTEYGHHVISSFEAVGGVSIIITDSNGRYVGLQDIRVEDTYPIRLTIADLIKLQRFLDTIK